MALEIICFTAVQVAREGSFFFFLKDVSEEEKFILGSRHSEVLHFLGSLF